MDHQNHHHHHHQPGMQQVYPSQGPAFYVGFPNGQYQQYPVPNGGASPPATYQAVAAPSQPTEPSGSKRTAFALLSIAVAILVIAVIGLSAGLGVSQKNLHDTQDDLSAALASFSTTAPATRTLVVSGTKTSSAATATATTSDKYSKCPSANNLVYSAQSSNETFTVYCGIDYGNGEAKDIDSAKTANMTACMDKCAADSKCDGAGWGYISGEAMCYLKANLTKSHTASNDWEFAVLNKTTRSNSTSKS